MPSFKESECDDHIDLDLTRQQVALIKAVSKAQPNTVVVLNNGTPVAMSDWIDGLSAILEGWMMGQAGGAAIASVLLAILWQLAILPELPHAHIGIAYDSR